MTHSAAAAAKVSLHPRRRSQPRFSMRALAYVRLDHNNGGIIRDLTESGVALQAVTPLQAGDELPLRFELFSPRVRVEARGRVAWADSNGQAGVCFTDFPPRARRAVRDWVLLQMLTAAVVSGRDSMFAPVSSQYVVSETAIPAIPVPFEPEPPMVRWGLLSLSVRSFSVLVDSLILLCAVLLFSVGAVAGMGGVPTLPITAALVFAAAAIFVTAYQLIFSDFLCGASPGKRLAAQASEAHRDDRFVTRFR